MPSDSSSITSAVTREIETALGLARAGHKAEAEQAFRHLLLVAPQCIPALRFLAAAALQRGGAGEAIDLLNRAAQVDRNDTGTLMELGVAYRVADRMDAARSVLERALELGGGRDNAIRLLLANVLELDQRPELALLHYFRAVLNAQHAGRWLDDSTTPPGLRPLVTHAMHYVDERRRALLDSALQASHQHDPVNGPDRIDRALTIYLREDHESPTDPRQRPTLLYIPDLSSSPLPTFPQHEWLTPLLTKVAAAGAEIDACLRWASRDTNTTWPAQMRTGTANSHADNTASIPSGERRAQVYRCGTITDATRRHAPQLLSAIAAAPLMRIPRYAPDATIIALPPAARTAPAHSRSNASCTVMLGLPGSAEIEITIGTDTYRLEAGGVVIGDGSYGIGYANPGAAEARVLVFDIWHPGLSAAEQQALTALLAAIVDFDTRLQELD